MTRRGPRGDRPSRRIGTALQPATQLAGARYGSVTE